MRILICDDDAQALDTLSCHVAAYMKDHSIEYEIVTYTDSSRIPENVDFFHLAFLDIEMGEVSGLEIAGRLKEQNGKIILFFVTNFEEYQDNAMDLRAFRYFPKPFDVRRLYSGLDSALEYIDSIYYDIFLLEGNSQCRIPVNDILYLSRENRRVILHTAQKNYTLRESFEECLSRLPVSFFYQVHKSFAVNIHHVQRYSYKALVMSDGSCISVAPRRQVSFHQFWNSYLRRH